MKLHNIPLQYWIDEGISYIASAVGKPLYADSLTATRKRISYARVCVEINAKCDLIESFDLLLDRSDDSGNPILVTIGVEFQWKPKVCLSCKTFGHAQSNCHKQVDNRPKDMAPQSLEASKLGKGKVIVSTTIVVEEPNQTSNTLPSSQLASSSVILNGIKEFVVTEEQAIPSSPPEKHKRSQLYEMEGNLNMCGGSIVVDISPAHPNVSEVEKDGLVDTENQWITQKRKKEKSQRRSLR